MSVKVDRQTVCELALRHLDAVAGAVLQHRDRIAVDRRRNRCFQRLVVGAVDLGYRLGDLLHAFTGVHPDVTLGRGLREAGGLLHFRLVRHRINGRLRTVRQNDVAVHRAARQHQAHALLRVAAACVDLNVAVDHAVAGHRHADGGVAAVAADVKGEAVCIVRVDRGVLDQSAAVVVGQRVRGRGVFRVVERQRHAVQGQVAVVLDKHSRLLRIDGTILEGDLVVLQQLERLGLGAGGTCQRILIHSVGFAAEVHREAFRAELALGNADTVAGAVGQHGDGVAVLSSRKGSSQSLVLGSVDLGDGGELRNDGSLLSDLSRAGSVGEVLVADVTSPVFDVAVRICSGRNSGMVGQGVARGGDDRLGQRDLSVACRVREVLLAHSALPIFDIASFGAGGSLSGSVRGGGVTVRKRLVPTNRIREGLLLKGRRESGLRVAAFLTRSSIIRRHGRRCGHNCRTIAFGAGKGNIRLPIAIHILIRIAPRRIVQIPGMARGGDLLIGRIVAARAGVIGIPADRRASRSLCGMIHQVVAQGGDDRLGQRDLSVACRVREVLPARSTLPVCNVTFFDAGGRLSRNV